MVSRRWFLSACGAAAACGSKQQTSGPGIRIVDDASGEPLPARVRLRDAEGADFVPEGLVEIPVQYDRWFASNGTIPPGLPAGRWEIRVERGAEYAPVATTIEVGGGGTETTEIRLRRWANMAERGWRCGENHIHRGSRDLAAILAAEGLDFGTSLYWWNGPRLEDPGDGEGIRRLNAAGQNFQASVYDAEVEHAWGAVYLMGLDRALTTPSDQSRPKFAFIREARQLGGLVAYQAGWSREVLFDALLGLVDVVNVCNNNFHRHKFQPRSRYSNLLEVDGLPIYPDTDEGMMRLNFETYYRLLNCGLRLAAGAGSACGVKSVPAGYNRAYVRCGSPASYPEFLEAWKKGRNFVTNGPMIFLETGEGAAPGDEIPRRGSANVRFHAVAESQQPLTALEIIANGEVVASASIPAGATSAEVAVELPLGESAWVCARAVERDDFLSEADLQAYSRRPDPPEEVDRDRPSRLKFGHTSPIYVGSINEPVRIPRSIEEGRAILDGFERFAKREADAESWTEIAALLPQARAVLARG